MRRRAGETREYLGARLPRRAPGRWRQAKAARPSTRAGDDHDRDERGRSLPAAPGQRVIVWRTCSTSPSRRWRWRSRRSRRFSPRRWAAKRVGQLADTLEREVKPLFGHSRHRPRRRAPQLARRRWSAPTVARRPSTRIDETLELVQASVLAPAREGRAPAPPPRRVCIRELRQACGRQSQRRRRRTVHSIHGLRSDQPVVEQPS